ncbi:MAG: hypothetical protein H6Q30_995 [Bacteroidetes bacterium]|jgi:hypothetical protein|nr:hypothetical protein [Bacteroidota bacterium]
MPTRSRIWLLLAIGIVCGVSSLRAQFTTLSWKLTTVGKVRQVLTNMGTLSPAQTRYPGLILCEFPPGSNEEHLFQGGIWIGAITPDGDTLLSETQSHYGFNEFFPSTEKWDTIWTVSKGDTAQIPYWPDYVAVSDQDFVCRYNDYNLLNVQGHTPLYVEIVQTTYSWGSGQLSEFLLHTYYIIIKKIPLKDAYIAFWMHSSVGSVNATDNFIDEYTRYYPKYHMGVAEDSPAGSDGRSYSPIGFSVMTPSDTTLRWSWNYFEHETLPSRGQPVYRVMSSGNIMPDRLDPARAHEILAFGPHQLRVGDTLKVEMAEVFGNGIDGMLKNVEYLQFLKAKDFRVPSPPPRPVLRATAKSHEIHLDWQPQPGDVNPETYSDPYRGDTITQPFEGYRLYKSTKGPTGPWTLLADFDKPGDIDGPNTGLQYQYTDVGLLNNIEYYYSLTSYSMPDRVINFPSQESSITASTRTTIPGTAPPLTVGEVAVVPNPYRGDVAYNSYNPPWEKPSGTRPWWMEQDRRLQFINLPADCEIKIFTLAGDLVNTISHHDPSRGYEDWNLTSYVGQAISSGLYLFTCQDLATGKVQVGKFVIIK